MVMVMAESNAVPTAEDRSQYESLRKELMQALPKKRLVDKQLVRDIHYPIDRNL